MAPSDVFLFQEMKYGLCGCLFRSEGDGIHEMHPSRKRLESLNSCICRLILWTSIEVLLGTTELISFSVQRLHDETKNVLIPLCIKSI
jgi:hypothetical protein